MGVTPPSRYTQLPPQGEGREAQPLGNAVDLGLGRELGLRCAEAAKRAVRRGVGGHRPAADPNIGALVRAAGMDRAPAQDDGGEGHVRPAVHHDLDVLGHERPFAGDAGTVPDPGRMALGGGADVLVSVVDHANRLAHPLRQQGGVEGDDRGVFLLTTKTTARLGLDDHGLDIGQVQGPLQGAMDVVRALHRTVDFDSAVEARDRDHGLVLDVQLLLVADPVLALDHDVRCGQPRLHVALGQLEMRELAVREERIEDRRAAVRCAG